MSEERREEQDQEFGPEQLRAIAGRQKILLLCILVYLVSVVARFVVPGGLQNVLLIAGIGASLLGTVMVVMLATKLYSTGLGILLGLLTLVPLLGLVILLVVNGRATAVLRESGVEVGLLGAKSTDW